MRPRLPAEPLERARALTLVEVSVAQVMATMTGGAALTGFALLLGATPLHIGMLSSLPAFAALAQISAPYWTQRLGSRRSVVLRCLGMARVEFLLIALLPFVPMALALKPIALVSLMTAAAALAAIGSTAWMSWLGDLVPRRMRGRYFASRSLVVGLVTLALGPLVGVYLDLPIWRGADGARGVAAFVTLFAAGTLVGWSSLLILRRVIEPAAPTPRPPARFRQDIARPWRDRDVRGYIIFRAAWAFSAGLCGNFFQVYLISQLGLSFSVIYALATLGALASLLSLRLWARLGDRVGARTAIVISSIGKALFPILYAFTAAGAWPMLILVHLFGVFEAGLTVNANTMLLNIVPRQNNTTHIAAYSAVVNLFSAVSPLIGGILVGSAAGLHLQAGGFSFSNYQVLFLISGVLRAASILLTLGFRDVRSDAQE